MWPPGDLLGDGPDHGPSSRVSQPLRRLCDNPGAQRPCRGRAGEGLAHPSYLAGSHNSTLKRSWCPLTIELSSGQKCGQSFPIAVLHARPECGAILSTARHRSRTWLASGYDAALVLKVCQVRCGWLQERRLSAASERLDGVRCGEVGTKFGTSGRPRRRSRKRRRPLLAHRAPEESSLPRWPASDLTTASQNAEATRMRGPSDEGIRPSFYEKDPVKTAARLRALVSGGHVATMSAPNKNPARDRDKQPARVGNYQHHPYWGLLAAQVWLR